MNEAEFKAARDEACAAIEDCITATNDVATLRQMCRDLHASSQDVSDELRVARDSLSHVRHALCLALGVDNVGLTPLDDLLLAVLSGERRPLSMEALDKLRPPGGRLVDLIRQAEWSCFIESAADDCCPWCKAARGRGTAESHEHTCPVVPVLYPKEHVK